MISTAEVETWPDLLQAALGSDDTLKRVFVLSETDSTQDAARRINAEPGYVVVAARQTQGRGRLGRAWADTGSGGIAMTMVLENAPPERLAIAAAVAVARGAQSLHHSEQVEDVIGIKWPNDITARGRKLAGILIEQFDNRMYVGVGMNVRQRTWPAELEGVAISLAELGASVARADTMAAVLRAMNAVITWSNDELVAAFHERDALTGQRATFRSGSAIIAGLVKAIDPLHRLVVAVDDGSEINLSAASTSVVKM